MSVEISPITKTECLQLMEEVENLAEEIDGKLTDIEQFINANGGNAEFRLLRHTLRYMMNMSTNEESAPKPAPERRKITLIAGNGDVLSETTTEAPAALNLDDAVALTDWAVETFGIDDKETEWGLRVEVEGEPASTFYPAYM